MIFKKIGKRHSHSCSHSRSFSHTDDSSFEAGIKVQIHSQDEPPFIDQLGFGVAPGFQTFVSCQEQRVGVVLICALKWIVICFDSCYLFFSWCIFLLHGGAASRPRQARITSKRTASAPVEQTARRATWWKTATAAWCICLVSHCNNYSST